MKRAAAYDRDDAGGQARRWIARLASGAATAQDLEQLQAWLRAAPENRAAFDRERSSWHDLALLEDAFAPSPVTAPGTGTTAQPRLRRWRPARPQLVGMALAASLMALWYAPELLLRLEADHRAPATRPMAIALADGSRAVLDAGSALSVAYDRDSRSVSLLKGRAWFAVRHGDPRPFRVHAGQGVTQDIGTTFAVEQAEGETRVGVTQGAVRVSGPAGTALSLTAGGRAHYQGSSDPRPLPSLDPALIANWRRGEILLRAVPVAQAIAEIGRYRAAPVFVWGDVSALPPVSGSFRTDKPDDAIATLRTMRGLEQIYLPGGILILRAPAQK